MYKSMNNGETERQSPKIIYTYAASLSRRLHIDNDGSPEPNFAANPPVPPFPASVRPHVCSLSSVTWNVHRSSHFPPHRSFSIDDLQRRVYWVTGRLVGWVSAKISTTRVETRRYSHKYELHPMLCVWIDLYYFIPRLLQTVGYLGYESSVDLHMNHAVVDVQRY